MRGIRRRGITAGPLHAATGIEGIALAVRPSDAAVRSLRPERADRRDTLRTMRARLTHIFTLHA
ncbi:hypothetical protein L2230_16020, partial [Xanthomonas perforans]|uniref:hypothetical protein n=1 Tax=Xanthomonas perforans TaxID=442694 RepID=UPI001F47716D